MTISKKLMCIIALSSCFQTTKAQNKQATIAFGLQDSYMHIISPLQAWHNAVGFNIQYSNAFAKQNLVHWGVRLTSVNFYGYEPIVLHKDIEKWHSLSMWELTPQLSFHLFNTSPKWYLALNLNPSARLRNHVGLDTVIYDGSINGSPIFAFQNFHEQIIDLGFSFEIEPHLYVSPKMDLGFGISAGTYTNRVKTMFNSRLVLYYHL
jgi:hypothetical protein